MSELSREERYAPARKVFRKSRDLAKDQIGIRNPYERFRISVSPVQVVEHGFLQESNGGVAATTDAAFREATSICEHCFYGATSMRTGSSRANSCRGGTCSKPIVVPAGTASVSETVVPGVSVAGIATLPAAGLLVSSHPVAGTALLTVAAGGQTIVTFINAVHTAGLVQVRKVAGTGVPVGTPFTFTFVVGCKARPSCH